MILSIIDIKLTYFFYNKAIIIILLLCYFATVENRDLCTGDNIGGNIKKLPHFPTREKSLKKS